MLGKKTSEKSAKNVFLYSNEYRDRKMGGEKSAKQFFQKHTNSAIKNVGEKSTKRSEKNVFFYSHEYRDQKMGGEKTRQTIFPETQE